MVSSFLKKYLVFRNLLILIIIVTLVLTFFSKQYAYFSFDLSITKFIQSINIPLFDQTLVFVSWLGNISESILTLIIGALALLIYGYKKESLVLTLSTLGAVTISETLKVIVSRPRPDALLINQVEHFFRADSFPSGHVLFFVGFYGFLLFLSFAKFKKGVTRNFLMSLFLILIILVGISRIYLGAHWFSDVLGGYLIGSIWLYFMILLYRKITLK